MARQYAGKVRIAAIALTSNVGSAQSFVDDYSMTTPLVLVDTAFRTSSHYNVYSTPNWILTDGSGNIIQRGTNTNDAMRNALAAAAP